MNKYSTLLLSSALLLASASGRTAALANTDAQPETVAGSEAVTASLPLSDPTKVETPLTTQQNGQTLSIFYQRTASQKDYKIQYAVWSNENGQDDLKWYVAGQEQTDIPLDQHQGEGQHTIHSYIVIQDRLVFLEEASLAISRPQPSITTSISEPGFLDIHVQHLPASVTEVRLPTWSNHNNQDDLRWYTASRNADGTYSLRVPLKQHHFETGPYSIHLYTKEGGQAPLKFVTKTEVTVQPDQIPSLQAPSMTIANRNERKGSYQIVVQEQSTSKQIQSVEVATWSTSNQSNIKWRNANLVNGKYLVNVSFQEHQNHTGIYKNHVYVYYTDGSRVGYVADSVNLSDARLPVSFSNRLAFTGSMQLTFGNIYDNGTVNYAVWSDENGQDDLHWYVASKTGHRTFSDTIPLDNHRGTGKYHVHVYQGGNGLGAFTMTVNASDRISEPNTYPVGQCTWGAKEAAPWVKNYWGNANQWLYSARAAGFQTGSEPRVGAVVVWEGGAYGHVGVVTEVANSHRIRIKEANYAGHQTLGDYRGWFDPISDGVSGYIYPR